MELADTDSGTGVQDAITPPWQTKFAMFAYIGSLLVIVGMWSEFGWQSGLGSLAVILFGAALARQILPKPSGEESPVTRCGGKEPQLIRRAGWSLPKKWPR